MGMMRMSAVAVTIAGLAACSGPTLSSNSFPGRTMVQFMSADRVTIRNYACVPGATQAQTQSRAAQAHRDVDAAIQSAFRRFSTQSGGGFGAGLGVRAEVNAVTARVSRQAEAEYRCTLVNSRDSRQDNFFG